MNCERAVLDRNAWREGRTEIVESVALHDCDATNPRQIHIYTLGRFGIAIDGRALYSNGKAKQRPLALLKVLIAWGGRCVAVSNLWGCLWPDSEGDVAARNLNITVHRLRQMLTPRAVLQQDGKLTLNENVCSVDLWEFERFANEGLERAADPGTRKDSEAHLRAALRLYGGHFLARECEEPWMLATRLRLKTKLERLVCSLSTWLEEQRRFAEASDICLRGLELDPLNELLYRRLMSCYLKRGELASVLATYRRCCEALCKGLSASVSSETERLYVEALHAGPRTNIGSTSVSSAPLSPQKRSLA